MKPFAYTAPDSLEDALDALGQENALPLAGGTDLIGSLKRGITAPEHLINLKSIPGLAEIRQTSDNGLSIGALARLSAIAGHSLVRRQYPILVQAVDRVATPQIRNLGTLGGNLCQRPRCWYYRHPDFSCARKGGEGCPAATGQNRYHAILGGHGCFIVHPSDSAVALIALDAGVRIAGSGGSRDLSLAGFFAGPAEDPVRETVLQPGEILTGIQIPPPPPDSRGIFLKATERQSTDFALASVAVLLVSQEGKIARARRPGRRGPGSVAGAASRGNSIEGGNIRRGDSTRLRCGRGRGASHEPERVQGGVGEGTPRKGARLSAGRGCHRIPASGLNQWAGH